MAERGRGRGRGRAKGGGAGGVGKGELQAEGFWELSQNGGSGKGGGQAAGGGGGGGKGRGRGKGRGVWGIDEGGREGEGGGKGVWDGGGGGKGRGVRDGRVAGGGVWNGGKTAGGKETKQVPQTKKSKVPGENTGSGERRFEAACREIQAGVDRYMANHTVQVDGSDDDNDNEEELQEESIMERVYGGYSGGTTEDRTQQYLQDAFRSGTIICLICIESVKRMHPIWNCGECYSSFHLHCIQKWAKDSLFQLSQAMEDATPMEKAALKWCCPKCRGQYAQWSIPSRYVCFCGRHEDPEFDPWLPPHSCGDTCGRSLVPTCGHSCLLLCHPGPCPPCPKTVTQACHCGQSAAKTVRCSAKEWSCSKRCPNTLSCRAHPCPNTCHPAPCPSCSKQSKQPCVCGADTKLCDCAAPPWHCEKVCGKPYRCGHHKCEKVCHTGDCGDCPRGGVRTCPCGKATHDIPCTQDVPGCGDTCGKQLACGVHYCAERCHRGQCPTCLQFRVKVCRCGVKKKEMACSKDLTCDIKCKRIRDCGRHTCNKKCCVGECGRCEQVCGRALGCGSHRCESRCHPGPCYPCSATHTLKCRCGVTSITLPCGRHRHTKPPRCNKPCLLPSVCHHPQQEPHRCHLGTCPFCRQVCGLRLPCSHICPVPCHHSVPVKVVEQKKRAGPWEPIVAPHVEIKKLPCPPCQVPVPTTCLGEHETPDLPCSEARIYSCGRKCGRRLACTHHTCQRECHKVEGDRVNCKPCEIQCSQPRPAGCTHPCPRSCHPGPCKLCSAMVRVRCHCNITQMYHPCHVLTQADGQAKEALLRCGNQCSKTMGCGHRCPLDCHSGKCGGTGPCQKKVVLKCPCKRLKKDYPCHLQNSGETTVQCDNVCRDKLEHLKKIKEEEERKKLEEEEERNRREVEEFEKMMEGRKGRRRKRRNLDEVEEDKRGLLHRYWMVGVVVMAVLSVVAAWAAGYM
ncbi:hypothetical protein Pcinc_011152 [Petrolisthes cinctipes]|uniref:NF-X1-type zinc finger protein NFXL1 n=1 Tax=Petrolisthes cinctipes TaxID=88211 RepID=A0AAE1G3R2_PETCI|nr:hypothetical protein Pcinc_011152 [Petrolisthes cinctipes]